MPTSGVCPTSVWRVLSPGGRGHHYGDGCGTSMKMALKGSRNADALASGEDELRGKVNYLIGNDQAQWHPGVSTFSKVRFAMSIGASTWSTTATRIWRCIYSPIPVCGGDDARDARPVRGDLFYGTGSCGQSAGNGRYSFRRIGNVRPDAYSDHRRSRGIHQLCRSGSQCSRVICSNVRRHRVSFSRMDSTVAVHTKGLKC
jgi:hypothetical protein